MKDKQFMISNKQLFYIKLSYSPKGVLLRIDLPSVTSSVYSNSPPTEIPFAMALIFLPSGLSRREI